MKQLHDFRMLVVHNSGEFLDQVHDIFILDSLGKTVVCCFTYSSCVLLPSGLQIHVPQGLTKKNHKNEDYTAVNSTEIIAK